MAGLEPPSTTSIPSIDGSTAGLSERSPADRRRSTRLACESCRTRKVACSGERPTCKACTRRHIACRYVHDIRDGETLQAAQRRELDVAKAHLDGVGNSIRFLSSLSEREAHRHLQRLALHAHPGLALSQLQHDQYRRLHLQPVQEPDTTPGERTMLQVKLMAHHPQAYPMLISMDPLSTPWRELTKDTLRVPRVLNAHDRWSNESRSSTTASKSSSPDMQHTDSSSQDHSWRSENADSRSSLPSDIIDKPKTYVDPRLKNLHATFWTGVPIRNAHAAKLISHYLEVDHPLLGFFDAELFVRDLVDQRGYGDSRTSSLAGAFLAEAKTSALTCWPTGNALHVAASQLLSLGCACNGSDRLAQYFKWEGAALAQRLGLFNILPNGDRSSVYKQWPRDQLVSTSQIAWGAFNWVCVHGQAYDGELAESAPPFPTPGECRLGAEAYGAVFQYDSRSRNIDKVFTALSKLRQIQADIALTHRASGPGTIADKIPLSYAEEKYGDLLDWASKLDSVASRQEGSPHYVLILHIWLHTTVVDLFRPFHRERRLESMTAADSTPQAVVAASVSQLKALAVSYYHLQNSASCTILWHSSLLYIGSDVLQDPACLAWRYYFEICINAYRHLSENFRIATGFLQGLLWIAIDNKRISVSEARETLKHIAQTQPYAPEDLRSGHVIHLRSTPNDMSTCSIEAMIDRLHDLTVADEVAAG